MLREGGLRAEIRSGCLITNTARGLTVMSWIDDCNKIKKKKPSWVKKGTSPCGITWSWFEIKAIINLTEPRSLNQAS